MIPIWLSVARMSVGVKETPGPVSTAVILQWAKDINAPAWYNNDDQAWCAVWMNRLMMACQLPLAGKGFDLLRALSFADKWGQSIKRPAPGCVLVFSRPEGAHVGLYIGESNDSYRVLGGNQGNAVSETWIAKDRLVAIRWPADVPITGDRVHLARDGSLLSGNEA